MRTIRLTALCIALGTSPCVVADSLTGDAAIGGAIGGALGGAVGAELGGRQGAIVGAGVGAAAGTALNTQQYAPPPLPRHEVYHYYDHGGPPPLQGPGFCPPGQRKKGRC